VGVGVGVGVGLRVGSETRRISTALRGGAARLAARCGSVLSSICMRSMHSRTRPFSLPVLVAAASIERRFSSPICFGLG